MRIAIVAPLVSPIAEPQMGGSQAVVADLARGLTGRGHEVDVYAAAGSEIDGANVVDTAIDPGSLSQDLFRAAEKPRRPSAASREAFAEVYSMIRRRGYDLAHNHAFDVPAVKPAVPLQIPLVHTLHLPFDDKIAEAVEEARAGPLPPVIAAVSRSHADDWSGAVRIDAVLPNGVDTKRIGYSQASGPSLLFVGRFCPEKGALEAVGIARRAALALLLVGSAYDAGYADRLHQAAGDAPADADISVEPPLPRAFLWRRMAACAALLCPAGWEEPYGLAAAEAQACGTPVIAFARGGLKEIIVDGITGNLVEPGDLDTAATAAMDAGTLSRRACRDHAETDLTLENSLDAHEALYRSVLSGSRADGIAK